MTWLKKDEEILGYEVREMDENQEYQFIHYCRQCFRDPPKESTITEFITKASFKDRKDQRLLCDHCGGLIGEIE